MTVLGKVEASHRERDPNYGGVVHVLGEWRVVVCKDGIQWIIQRRTRAGSPDGARWRGLHYCVSRRALVRLWSGLTGDDGVWLRERLPEYCGADL